MLILLIPLLATTAIITTAQLYLHSKKLKMCAKIAPPNILALLDGLD